MGLVETKLFVLPLSTCATWTECRRRRVATNQRGGVYMSPAKSCVGASIDKPVHSAGIFNPGEWTKEISRLFHCAPRAGQVGVVAPNELHLSYTTQDTVEIFRMADGKQTELLP